VLVVGCGDGTAGYGPLTEVDGSEWLETDVSLAGRARMVCDASDLPLADEQFDLVICIAVLEHVLEPQRCVDEVHRVLRSDGQVYATTPFMQQVHMGEYDFTRFTRSGHRWLFRHFDEVDSGMATGPASVLVWSVEYFLMSWTSSVAGRRVAKGLTRVLLGWLTLLDPLLSKRAASHDAAGGFYFIGRRAKAPTLAARDMVDYYRGADALK
jgi:SAM-dependent methyltransferase